jgi:hypothetical protein
MCRRHGRHPASAQKRGGETSLIAAKNSSLTLYRRLLRQARPYWPQSRHGSNLRASKFSKGIESRLFTASLVSDRADPRSLRNAVIAKQCSYESALAERTIYEAILPHLPLPRLLGQEVPDLAESGDCAAAIRRERHAPADEGDTDRSAPAADR